MLQRYEILGEVGRGGMGVVYRARDREAEEVVALKILRPEIAENEDMLWRFRNELRLARKITHKNVCRTFDILRFGQYVVISMEYVEGESLRARIARLGELSPSDGIPIAQQICDGLREAHSQQIVHRDLKPENIMIDPSGNVKVMDFGIARSVRIDATMTTGIVGTPAYMAPEQAEGHEVDARTDIYAVGLILYEMFTGRPAFTGDTAVAIALRQIREIPTPPQNLEPRLSNALQSVILQCLQKSPDKRFQSVNELKSALAEVVEASTQRGASAATTATHKWRLRTAIILGAAFVAALLIGWQIKQSAVESPLQVLGSNPATAQRTGAGQGQSQDPAPPQSSTAAAGSSRLATIAVLPFVNSVADPKFSGFSSGISDSIAAVYLHSGGYQVLERAQLDAAIKELKLSQSELVDPASAQRIGKMVGAQYLVLGSFQVWQQQIRIHGRLLRVETGEILAAEQITGDMKDAMTLQDRLGTLLLAHGLSRPAGK